MSAVPPPRDPGPRVPDAQAFADHARQSGVRFVACSFVDTAGVNRVKVVPLARFVRTARSGLGISRSLTVYTAHDDVVALPGLDPAVGDLRLLPDVSGARVLAGLDSWALCPVDQCTPGGAPQSTCARGLLRGAVAEAAAAGVTASMAYEIEFTLLDEAGRPAHSGPAYGSRPLIGSRIAEEVLDAFSATGLEPEQLHAEYAPGQFEVAVAPADPVAATDRYVAGRWLIAALAARHGYRASFAPVPQLGWVGNGAHLHVSIARGGAALLAAGDAGEPRHEEGRSFIAGVLATLPAMMSVYAPSVPSYWRLAPGRWSGATACWGVENRETALRYVPSRGDGGNLEVKVIDGASNPYIAAACVLASGLAGLRDGTQLPASLDVDPRGMTDAQRDAARVAELPSSLDEAIARSRADHRFAAILGPDLAEAFLATRSRDCERDSALGPEGVLADHLLRYG